MDKMRKGADWSDWQIKSTYDYTVGLTRLGWAWEFLRRNPDFRCELTKSLKEVEIAKIGSDVKVIGLPRDSVDRKRWGLQFRGFTEQRGGGVLVFPPVPVRAAGRCRTARVSI